MAEGHIHKHLHSMFHLLRSEETLKMAVKLESARYGRTRYLVVVSCTRKPTQRELNTQQNLNIFNAQINRKSTTITTNTSTIMTSHKTSSYTSSNNLPSNYIKSGTQILINDREQRSNIICRTGSMGSPQDWENISDRGSGLSDRSPKMSTRLESKNLNEIEESCLLGIDCNEKTTVGLVLRILGDTTIRLDGDGGICINACGRTHIFKPVSVQAMWSALQTLHRVSAKARENNFYPGGPSHNWVSYYEDRIQSDRSCLNEWNAMDSIESKRPPSPDAISTKPTEREEIERMIKSTLKEIIIQLDLDEVTSKYIRTRLEEHMAMDLSKYKSYIDQEMLTILGQMDAPTKIFDHVYLGSEWNASNLEELQKNGVRHILNVTREIDNFFPGMFDYFNVRVYDDEKTNLLKHWDNTFRYISRVKNNGSKVLVHCKMGVSRSASVVIAYAMKAYDLTFNQALDHVKQHRHCIKPNKNFLTQLETYQGMLMAMKNKEKLQRSKSDTNLRSSKDARLLPGSEPTPLIQAFNAAAKKSITDTLQSRTLHCANNRPKSWSPDNVESIVLLPKQHSLSMENLPPESKTDCTKNVRLPCINGQNYSVSQNQVFHLQENNSLQHCSSVRHIVNKLESGQRNRNDRTDRTDRTDRSDYKTVNKDTWDPGERPTTDYMRQNLIDNRLMTAKNQTSTTICDTNSSSKQIIYNESSFSNLGRELNTTKHTMSSSHTSPASENAYNSLRKFKSDVTSVADVIAAVNAASGTSATMPNLKIGGGSGTRVNQHCTASIVPKSAWTRSNTYNVNSNKSSTRLTSSSSGPSLSSSATSFLDAAPELIPEFHSGPKHIKTNFKPRIDCNTIMLTKSEYYPPIKSRNVT